MPDEIKAKIEYIADHYGLEHQKLKMCEELAELIQALLKGDIKNIIEEMADVRLMWLQLVYLMQNQGDINQIMVDKINRQIKRINE